MGPLYEIAEAIYEFMMSGPPLPVALIYLSVAAIPVVLVHELGHAVVARRRLGVDVHVEIGSAGRLGAVRLGQVTASINALSHPGRSGGSASFDASRATARDVLLIALAGPAASLAQTALCALLLSAAPVEGVLHDFLWATVGAGAFGVLNVVPLELVERRDEPPVATDGRLALDALRVMRMVRQLG